MTKAGKKIIAGMEEAVRVAKGERAAPVTLKPTRSEPLRFRGRIIAETEWDTNRGEWMRFEIWETQGGAYIATREGSIPGTDRTDLEACVVEPITKSEPPVVKEVHGSDGGRILHLGPPEKVPDDPAMHRAVLDFFDWHDRARSMVKPLKWKLLREVA